MTIAPTGDPAFDLWQRVPLNTMSLFSDLLSEIPIPVGKIAARLELDVASLTLSPDISGLIKRVSIEPLRFEIQVNNTDAPVRQRFTVAHEISHFLLHRDEIDNDGITDTVLYRSKLSSRKEVEANRLAAAILIPWEKVMTWSHSKFGCDPNSSHLSEISQTFKVSSLAAGFRLKI